MKKTIKFLTGNPNSFYFHNKSSIFINPVQHMLKTYHDHFGRSKDDYIWLKCKHTLSNNIDSYIEDVSKEDIDILCVSVYVWNVLFYEDFIKKYKKLKPSTTIIVGGPEINARSDPEWFLKHSEVNYVVYGDGEKAFSNLLDMIAGYDIKIENIPNVIYLNDKNERIVNKHEVMRDKNYWALNPFSYCKDYFKKEIDDVLKHETFPVLIWERSRGCPYSCSFCDWSGGLHNKVSRRSCSFKDEIDAMLSINNKDIGYYIADANFGIFDEDFEIIKYISENIRKKYPNFYVSIPNWSKTNKERVFKIWDYILQNKCWINDEYQKTFKISIQDIHDEILKNIDRPSIPWKDVKDYYLSRRNDYNPHLELICGLPGQTRKTWNETLFEIVDIEPYFITHNYFMFLPYSPAGNNEYRNKHNLKYISTIVPKNSITKQITIDRDSLIKSITKNLEKSTEDYMIFNMITESYSYNLEDLIYFHLSANYMYNLLLQSKNIKNKIKSKLNVIKLIKEKFIKSMPMLEKLAKQQYDIIKNDYDKYGVLLFCSKHPNGYYCDYQSWFNSFMHNGYFSTTHQIENFW